MVGYTDERNSVIYSLLVRRRNSYETQHILYFYYTPVAPLKTCFWRLLGEEFPTPNLPVGATSGFPTLTFHLITGEVCGVRAQMRRAFKRKSGLLSRKSHKSHKSRFRPSILPPFHSFLSSEYLKILQKVKRKTRCGLETPLCYSIYYLYD